VKASCLFVGKAISRDFGRGLWFFSHGSAVGKDVDQLTQNGTSARHLRCAEMTNEDAT
jgi:hypothetical protein